MAINGKAEIIIEADDQYTVLVQYADTVAGQTFAVSSLSNQTLAAAFNKARDDLAALATGGTKHRRITVTTFIE